LVRSATDLELLADVPLNVVCFRFNPGGLHEEQLNRLNEMLGKAILADGRVYVGTTRYKNQTALRPAIVNWRTSDKDIEFFIDVVRELAAGLHVE
jgi:glutamate/tyrosine decarboxylase-like PLP-dependent enzyme